MRCDLCVESLTDTVLRTGENDTGGFVSPYLVAVGNSVGLTGIDGLKTSNLGWQQAINR